MHPPTIEITREHKIELDVDWLWLHDPEWIMRVARVVCYPGNEDLHKENARRLCAAWNATAQIPVEALEQGCVAELVEAAQIIADWQCERGSDDQPLPPDSQEESLGDLMRALAKIGGA